jgi:hypothetical protein
VVSIDPPEGSVEAEYCNAFYYTCRDAVLEAHPWNFTIGHDAAPAQVTSPTLTWQYAYAMPNGADDILAVLPPQASNPYSQGIVPDSIALSYGAPTPIGGGFVPQQFELLTTSTGAIVICTNQPNAEIVYRFKNTDVSKYSAMVTVAISRLLASHLAGPVIQGKEGRDEAKNQLQLYKIALDDAKTDDANQRKINPVHVPSGIAARQ